MNDWVAIADRALALGDFAESVDAYRYALLQSPTNATAWYNLGYALKADRQFEAALGAYGAAIANTVDQPEAAHVNRAAIYSEHLGQFDNARTELQRALAHDPHYLPALLNLANLAEDHGDKAMAGQVYRQIIAYYPGNGRALMRLAIIAASEGRADTVIAPIEQALSNRSVDPDDRIDLMFGLATALDAIGEHGQALDIALAANRLDRDLVPHALRYNPGVHEKMVAGLCATPLPTSVQRVLTGSSPITSPIFICGLFRSGSTLLEQILGRHPLLWAAGELDFVPTIVARQVQPYPTALGTATVTDHLAWRSNYDRQLARVAPRDRIVLDKRCDNFLHIGLIKTMFPDARIIHTVRNALDAMVSTLFLRFGPAVPYGFTPDQFAHWYKHYMQLMAHWKALYGDMIIDVAYEDIIGRPEPTVRTLLTKLGLGWNPLCLDNEHASIVQTASAWQVRQPLHNRSVDRWHHYSEGLSAFPEAMAMVETAASMATVTGPQ